MLGSSPASTWHPPPSPGTPPGARAHHHQGPPALRLWRQCCWPRRGRNKPGWRRERENGLTQEMEKRGLAGAAHSPVDTLGSHTLLTGQGKRNKPSWSSDTSSAPRPQSAGAPPLPPQGFQSHPGDGSCLNHPTPGQTLGHSLSARGEPQTYNLLSTVVTLRVPGRFWRPGADP